MRTDQQYFERAYSTDPQVFGRVDGWYETRKRRVLLASLMQSRYVSVFEPGGGIAALTLPLAERSDQLLMMDCSVHALRYAAEAMTVYSHVQFLQGSLPESWPVQQQFDLIVFSEILYYLTEVEVVDVAERALQSSIEGGEIALLHWRHASQDYPLTGAKAHSIFKSTCTSLRRCVHHEEQDFILDILR